MTNISPIIVVGFGIGQIYQIVEQEQDRDSQDYECWKLILIHCCNIEAHTSSVDYGNNEVWLLKNTNLEFFFILAKTLFLSFH